MCPLTWTAILSNVEIHEVNSYYILKIFTTCYFLLNSLAIKPFLSRVLWVCGLMCTIQGLMAQGTFSRAGELTFIHSEANIVQYYNDTALTRLKQSWRASKTPFTVAHFGDEHVQADVPSQELSNKILQAEGHGGWGCNQPQ